MKRLAPGMYEDEQGLHLSLDEIAKETGTDPAWLDTEIEGLLGQVWPEVYPEAPLPEIVFVDTPPKPKPPKPIRSPKPPPPPEKTDAELAAEEFEFRRENNRRRAQGLPITNLGRKKRFRNMSNDELRALL